MVALLLRDSFAFGDLAAPQPAFPQTLCRRGHAKPFIAFVCLFLHIEALEILPLDTPFPSPFDAL